MGKQLFCTASLILLTLSIVGCNKKTTPALNEVSVIPKHAVAVIIPINNSGVQGIVDFSTVTEGIKVEATLTGLTPGKHGFHIHEFGDISSIDGSSAGGHFNPERLAHGSPATSNRHCGDLGNITADNDGYAYLNYIDKSLSFEGAHSILGRGVIVHESEDDFSTQPTGGAGSRIGQGTIGLSKEK